MLFGYMDPQGLVVWGSRLAGLRVRARDHFLLSRAFEFGLGKAFVTSYLGIQKPILFLGVLPSN